MDAIRLKGTEDTPAVIFDAAANIFELSGKSMPENVAAFYGPILSWIDEYGNKPNPDTVVNFKLEYFNTASSKMIMDIMSKFEDIANDGNKVKMKWHYLEVDEDMLEAGEGYSEIVDVPFEMVSY